MRDTSQDDATEKCGEIAQHRARVFEDVPVRVCPELLAPSACLPLALPSLLPGVARVVEAVSVEFDGQPELRPVTVEPAAVGRLIGNRQREVRPPQQLQEPRLEFAER